MLDLKDLQFFVQIVDSGGFTAASRSLKVPKSTLSQRMTWLERDFGVRLLNRTSRHVGVTEAGRDFYDHAMDVLRGVHRAESVVRQRSSQPSGVVRVTAGTATMRYVLNDIIADFLSVHPSVNVVAHASDLSVDIVKENFDVAVRGHSDRLTDSSLVQRKLATMSFQLFAGVDYLSKYGEPVVPDELRARPALFMMRDATPSVWRLSNQKNAEPDAVVPLIPRLTTNDVCGLQKAAIAGLGIVALPLLVCRDSVRSGALRRILPDWVAGSGCITALTQYRQGMLPSVRTFVDFLGSEIPKLVGD